MRLLPMLLGAAALGGCASSQPPPLPMPSPQVPRIAINRPAPTPAAAPMSVRPAPRWTVLKSDGNVSAMLSRWARESGGSWTVRWGDVPDIAITGDSQVDRPDFLSAAGLVIDQLAKQGHRIKAKAYADNVLEITKKGDQE